MLDLRSLQQFPDLPKFARCLTLSKSEMILQFIPSAKKNKFLIIALLIDTPCTTVRKRRVRTKSSSPKFKGSIESILVVRLDKVPTYSNDRRIKGNTGTRWL